MKLFGWKAGRDGSRPALSRHGGGTVAGSAPGEWPRSYEAQVREGYLGNAVAQRAVRLVAQSVGGAPLAASDDRLLALATERARVGSAGGPPLLVCSSNIVLSQGSRAPPSSLPPSQAAAARFVL